MLLEMLKSKIHRATVTQADLHYVGSLTIDADLMNAANLLPNERVDVVDVDNGARLTTYVIKGEAGSGVIGINGAAARLISPGDLIIIINYAQVPAEIADTFEPAVVFVDANNRANSNDHPDTASAINSLRASVGLRHFSVLRGLPFSSAATVSSSA